MDIVHTKWFDFGESLSVDNLPFYFQAEQWENNNPLSGLVVPPNANVESFFGTVIKNIYIVAEPIGWEVNELGQWEENWPPEGFDEAIQRHIDTFEQFSFYQTDVWIDWEIVETLMAINPSSRFGEMMGATETRMMEMCETLAAYGFTFKGRDPSYSVLQETIDIHKEL